MSNQICINEEMLTNYTYFKLHDPAAHKYNSTLEYRREETNYTLFIAFVIHRPLIMAQSWAESTWEITNYGRFINQFPPIIIRSIQQFERINKKYVDKKCLLCPNKYVSMKKCCQYIYIYIYIYIHIYMYINIYIYI